MKKEVDEKTALQKMARYCSMGEHCISEVTEKLRNWKLESQAIERIIEYLIKEKYIDEERFCRAYIHDKLLNNKWGKIKINYYLSHKRIPKNIIDTYLAEIEEEKYQFVLRKVLRSKAGTLKSENDFEFRNKLMQFANSRGFELDAISKSLASLTDEE